MIAPGFIQELLARTDIVEVVARHVELKKGGANLMGLCPFHGEKSPSFSVSPAKQFYYCFGCGASGDAIKFLVEHTGASFRDAVSDLAQRAGMTVPEDDARTPEQRAEAARQREQQATLVDVLARAGEHYRKQLKASPRAIDYLKQRGLTGEVARRFGIGYAPDGWHALASAFARYDDPLLAEAGLVIVQPGEGAEGQAGAERRYDRFRDRIMFPIRSVQGEVIGFGGRVLDAGEPKYLNSPETPVFVKGRELYGLFEARAAIREHGHALVVEGYMDVVALAQLGFGNAVATLGTACTEEHVKKLLRFTDAIVFSFDGDAAGRRAARRALEAALPHASDTRSIRFLFLPAEHDPDSFVRSEGATAFDRAIQQAIPLSRQLIEAARDGCELDSAEGRARLLAQARPLWMALPDGALRRQLLGELAALSGLPHAELASLWRVGTAAPQAAAHAGAPTPAAFGRSAPPRSRTIAPRRAPRRPEDQVVHMLFGQSAWWDTLTSEDLELLHALAPPHAGLVAWLERELAEHGARPWAVVQAALNEEPALAEALAAMAGPAAAEPTLPDLRSALDTLLLADIDRRMRELAAGMAVDAQAQAQYLKLREHRAGLSERRAAARQAGSG